MAAALSVVCLALFQLEVVRFRALKRSPDLLVGGAFGLTAVANLSIGAGLAALGLGVEAWRLEILILLSLLCHGLAFALFAIAVVHYGRALSRPASVVGTPGQRRAARVADRRSVLVFGSLVCWLPLRQRHCCFSPCLASGCLQIGRQTATLRC